MAGKISKSNADAAADTMMSPPPPSAATPAAIEPRSTVEPGVRSAERAIGGSRPAARARCLVRDEVRAYLRAACPEPLRVRVESHAEDCIACRRWVRHIADEILEYIGGQRSEEELARMDAHLDACEACRDLAQQVMQRMAQSWTGDGQEAPGSGTTFNPGSIINGRYRILSFVGRGGMGEVYEAFDQLMDRRIALKTVLCTVADRPRAARRFKEEVRNAQRVGHPNVCRINDLQEHHDGVFGPPVPFFTMEFIDGERLGNRLTAGPLPIEHARRIALQLLSGLEAAHARGVLHLDFKSDNVMLRRDARAPDAVIMDFGLSRVLGTESRLRTSDRRQFAGTLPYMSVEQLECRDDLGPATDIYAFGVVLYEMLTRAFPFEGDSLGAVLLRQLKERPKPPSRHVPELSPALDRFVLRCLQRDPRARFADAGRARAALEAISHWSRPARAARLWRTAAPIAAVVAGGVIIAVSSLRGPAAPGAGDGAGLQTAGVARALETASHELGTSRALAAPQVAAAPSSGGGEAPADEGASPAAPEGDALGPSAASVSSTTSPSSAIGEPAIAPESSPSSAPALEAAPRARAPEAPEPGTRPAATPLPGMAAPPRAIRDGSSGEPSAPGAEASTQGTRATPARATPEAATRRLPMGPAIGAPEPPALDEPPAPEGTSWRPARVPKRLTAP